MSSSTIQQEWREEAIPAVLDALRPEWGALRVLFREPCRSREGKDLLEILGSMFPPVGLDLRPGTWGSVPAATRKERLEWRGVFLSALLLSMHREEPWEGVDLEAILVPDFRQRAITLLDASPVPEPLPPSPSASPAAQREYLQSRLCVRARELRRTLDKPASRVPSQAQTIQKAFLRRMGAGMTLQSLGVNSYEALVEVLRPSVPSLPNGQPLYQLELANRSNGLRPVLLVWDEPAGCRDKLVRAIRERYLHSANVNSVPSETWNCTSLLSTFPLARLGVANLPALVQVMNPALAGLGYRLQLAGPSSAQLHLVPLQSSGSPGPSGTGSGSPAGPSASPENAWEGPVHITLVDSGAKATQALALLQQQTTLAVDVEGSFHTARPDVWLIQVGVAHQPHAYLFDLLCPDHAAITQAVRALLEDPAILKIFHDARTDRRVLQQALRISVHNLQDTQVLHAMGQRLRALGTGKRAPDDRPGLNSLLQAHGLPLNPHKKAMQALFDQPQQCAARWTQRPMDAQVQEYAAHDVLYLCLLAQRLEAALHQHAHQAVSLLSERSAGSSSPEASEQAPANGEVQYMWMSPDLTIHRGATPPEADQLSQGLPARLQYTPPNEEDLDLLLLQLPSDFAAQVRALMATVQRPLLEIKLDAGRRPVLLFADEPERVLETWKPLAVMPVVRALAEYSGVNAEASDTLFTSDHRMGLTSTLHRISCLKSRQGDIIGLTLRIGRHVPQVVELVLDLVARVAHEGRNLLLLGAPGMGKTTLLRSVIQALSLHFQRRVIVVDTSNEIAGDGVVPHSSIGHARRMQVPDRARQHDVLIEAVQNHNPQVIVVDEIGTTQETRAASTIVQRGVAMVGTAHGRDLASLLHNPELDLLVGGHQQLLLGDEEMRVRAKLSGGPKQKIIWQRRMEPIFGQVIEILDWHAYKIYPCTADAVDALLGVKGACQVEYRSRTPQGFTSRFEAYPPPGQASAFSPPSPLAAMDSLFSTLLRS